MKRRHDNRQTRESIASPMVAGLVILLLAVPGLALAERKRAQRQLPAGARQAADRGPTRASEAADPALESAIGALRSAFGPTADPALAPRGDLSAAYVARSRGGYVQTVAAPAGEAYDLSRSGPLRGPEARALAFLREHGVAFGLSRSVADPAGASLNAQSVRSRSGRTTVRLEQSFAGLRVFGARALVQLEASGGVSFAVADLARDDARLFEPTFPTRPTVAAQAARSLARGVLSPEQDVLDLAITAPELMVYEPSVIGSAGPTRLVWHVRVTSATAAGQRGRAGGRRDSGGRLPLLRDHGRQEPARSTT